MNMIFQSIKSILPNRIWTVGTRFYYMMHKLLSYSIHKAYCIFFRQSKDRVLLIATNSSNEQIEEIRSRCSFYIPHVSMEILEIKTKQKVPLKIIFSNEPILAFGDAELKHSWIYKYLGRFFYVDYFHNPVDGWEWHNLLKYMSKFNSRNYIPQSKFRFSNRIKELKNENLNKCYVFGTGPSLEKAINRDWSDGYRVVCNTIVRDKDLWEHLDPHFIVAGDAIYHFGHTTFAKTFRKDLAERLYKSKTFFVYPDMFHEFVLKEFSDFSDRLIPIPIGYHEKINKDISYHFNLPRLGNVLALLLLPLGCTLSKNVYMFGFDGRAPDDKLFWCNSTKHSYPEFMHELQKSHPCFFKHYVPKSNPTKYVNDVHGDSLDKCMLIAENEGWHFYMMHKSWTPTLQKRYIE